VLAAGLADGAFQRLQGFADVLAAAFEPEGAHGDRVAVVLHLVRGLGRPNRLPEIGVCTFAHVRPHNDVRPKQVW
jgi:hypothetical protein